jgi:hypothetical protein
MPNPGHLPRRKFLFLWTSLLWKPATFPSELPQPKFQIGDPVYHEWILDDAIDPDNGSLYRYWGRIEGLVFSPDYCFERG